MKRTGKAISLWLLNTLAMGVVSSGGCGPDPLDMEHDLTVTIDGEGDFALTPAEGRLLEGTEVTVFVRPTDGWAFTHWEGDVPAGAATSNPLIIPMLEDTALVAVFAPLYALTVDIQGNGNVDPTDGAFVEGAELVLTAVADAGYVFDHWAGDVPIGGEAQNPSTTVITADLEVTAVFLAQYTLTTQVHGNGHIEPSEGTFLEETDVVLTAIADAGWSFDHWGEDASGTTNPLTIIMDSSKTITASFESHGPRPRRYTVSVEIQGEGTVEPAGGTFAQGTQLTLEATPAEDWVFFQWTGDRNEFGNPLTLTVNRNLNVIAVFEPDGIPLYTLSVTVDPEGAGTVDPPGGSFYKGSEVLLTAVSETGWTFDHWDDVSAPDQVDGNRVTVVMNANRTITAVFTEESGGPDRVSDPSPVDGATGVSIESDLDWADAAGATSYDVYFGTTDPPPPVGNTTTSNWVLETLSHNTTYYWKIVAKNSVGETPGPVWSFATQAQSTGPRDGLWEGTTHQGRNISFRVSSGGTRIGSFHILYHFTGAYCSYDGEMSSTATFPILGTNTFAGSIGGGGTSISLSGTFSGNETASGNAQVTDSYCIGTNNLTWTASWTED